jgi:predicted  nucleic acid-binding Zn-ribbon protein
MHPDRSALLDLQQATQSLSGLSDREQVMTLKHELVHAIERSSDFQSRSVALEIRVAELEAQVHALDDAQDTLVRNLRIEHAKEIRKLRLERLATDVQCDALDELCRSLLLTIERAIDGDVEERDGSDGEDQPRVSAS